MKIVLILELLEILSSQVWYKIERLDPILIDVTWFKKYMGLPQIIGRSKRQAFVEIKIRV